eukprot:4347860-Amphidinium_carterae.1
MQSMRSLSLRSTADVNMMGEAAAPANLRQQCTIARSRGLAGKLFPRQDLSGNCACLPMQKHETILSYLHADTQACSTMYITILQRVGGRSPMDK